MEARDERRLLNPQRNLSRLGLLIIDELGFVPLSPRGRTREFHRTEHERGRTKTQPLALKPDQRQPKCTTFRNEEKIR